jgi:hypothetical protein
LSARQLLHDMICLLGVVALVWAFHVYVRVLPTPWLAAMWFLLALLIALAHFHHGRVRRRAFLAVYIAPESPLQAWLRGGVLLALRGLLLGTVLALVLMLGLARVGSGWPWLALIGSVPLLVLLRAWLLRRMAPHASTAYLPLLSWRMAALAVGILLVMALAWLALQQEYPAFAGVSLERAVWHMVDQEHARSAPAQALLQAAAAKDGLRLWLAQQLMPVPGISPMQLLGWALVFAAEALFVWSYLLLSHGVLIGAGAYDRAWR